MRAGARSVLAAGARGVVACSVPMDCAVCQSPVDVDATRCAACGASLYEDDDAATVAGPRFMDVGALLPLGEVLAERWELEERLGVEGPFSRFRAIDQESDARVCVTVVARELLPGTAEREGVGDRLDACVGVGNRYVPGLLDVDRERALLFVVEPLVAGPSLRSVLDARHARGETMQVSEVLPVVAQLAAALAGLPPPHRHGDVRAERVVVGREGLRLVLPFLLPALPGAALVRLLAPDDVWRRALAPEVLRGAAGDAADRFGVAAIALEALTGQPPGGPFPALRVGLAPVEDALRELLAPDPSARPPRSSGSSRRSPSARIFPCPTSTRGRSGGCVGALRIARVRRKAQRRRCPRGRAPPCPARIRRSAPPRSMRTVVSPPLRRATDKATTSLMNPAMGGRHGRSRSSLRPWWRRARRFRPLVRFERSLCRS